MVSTMAMEIPGEGAYFESPVLGADELERAVCPGLTIGDHLDARGFSDRSRVG